jgi:hypothetical protein
VDAFQFARPVQAGQLHGIASVGLLSTAFWLRSLGRSHDNALDAQLPQPAVQADAGRPSLVNDVQHDVFAPEFPQVLFDRAQVARDCRVQTNFTAADAIGDRDYRLISVDDCLLIYSRRTSNLKLGPFQLPFDPSRIAATVENSPHSYKNQQNKAVDSTPTRVTPPAEQEASHGQP